MLQFFTKDKTYIGTIESHWFDSFRYGDINNVTIEGNPEQYLGSLVYIWINGVNIGSGYVLGYSHNKGENMSSLDIYPIITELKGDFVQEVPYLWIEDGILLLDTWDGLLLEDAITINKSYDDDMANIIEDLILSLTGTKTLYIKSKTLTGKNLKYDFVNVSLLEAYNQVVDRFIGSDFSVVIENDGCVIIWYQPITPQFSFGSDILKLEYEKDSSEIVNFIRFTNNKLGAELIENDYQDIDSVALYWKRVLYISDERFNNIESVDEYCNNILVKKGKPRIKVDSIKTLRSGIRVGDKVSISNWEKNFDDDLYINSITYQKDNSYILDIGTKESRQDLLTI